MIPFHETNPNFSAFKLLGFFFKFLAPLHCNDSNCGHGQIMLCMCVVRRKLNRLDVLVLDCFKSAIKFWEKKSKKQMHKLTFLLFYRGVLLFVLLLPRHCIIDDCLAIISITGSLFCASMIILGMIIKDSIMNTECSPVD